MHTSFFLKKIYDFCTTRNMSHSYNTRFRLKHQNSTSNAKKNEDRTKRVLRSDTHLKRQTYKMYCLCIELYEHLVQVGIITSPDAIQVLQDRKDDIEHFDERANYSDDSIFKYQQACSINVLKRIIHNPRFAVPCQHIIRDNQTLIHSIQDL